MDNLNDCNAFKRNVEVFKKCIMQNLRYKISSHLKVITYRDIDKMICVWRNIVYRSRE
jgi:hypothetical protein